METRIAIPKGNLERVHVVFLPQVTPTANGLASLLEAKATEWRRRIPHGEPIIFLCHEESVKDIDSPHTLTRPLFSKLAKKLEVHDVHAFFSLSERVGRQPSNAGYILSSSKVYRQSKRTNSDYDREKMGYVYPDVLFPVVQTQEYLHASARWKSRRKKLITKPFLTVKIGGRTFELRVCGDVTEPSEPMNAITLVPASTLHPTQISELIGQRDAIMVNDKWKKMSNIADVTINNSGLRKRTDKSPIEKKELDLQRDIDDANSSLQKFNVLVHFDKSGS